MKILDGIVEVVMKPQSLGSDLLAEELKKRALGAYSGELSEGESDYITGICRLLSCTKKVELIKETESPEVRAFVEFFTLYGCSDASYKVCQSADLFKFLADVPYLIHGEWWDAFGEARNITRINPATAPLNLLTPEQQGALKDKNSPLVGIEKPLQNGG